MRIERRVRRAAATLTTAAVITAGSALTAAASPAATPDLPAAVRYLVTTTSANGTVGGPSLAHDGYYDAFTDFADFGLTMDGALSLAATGSDDAVLSRVVAFLRTGHDASGRTTASYTQLGTGYASGGAIAKEALVAEATGYDPRTFGGDDLIAGLDATACPAPDPATQCPAAGGFAYSESTFDQALAVLAQLRAADRSGATSSIAYLVSLQHSDGAFPSLLPDDVSDDVDSTSVAAMALSLAAADPAATTAQRDADAAQLIRATTWLASVQLTGGGWTGTAGDSTNSAALAVEALHLAGTTYAAQIARGVAFLATQQGIDGGFEVAVGTPGSDVRASTQAVSGIVGTSLGVVLDDVTATHPPTPVPPASTSTAPITRSPATAAAVAASATPSLPFTGADVTGWSWLAGALLMTGAALVVGARRVRRPPGAHR